MELTKTGTNEVWRILHYLSTTWEGKHFCSLFIGRRFKVQKCSATFPRPLCRKLRSRDPILEMPVSPSHTHEYPPPGLAFQHSLIVLRDLRWWFSKCCPPLGVFIIILSCLSLSLSFAPGGTGRFSRGCVMGKLNADADTRTQLPSMKPETKKIY